MLLPAVLCRRELFYMVAGKGTSPNPAADNESLHLPICQLPLNFLALWRCYGLPLDLHVLWMLVHAISLVWHPERQHCISTDLTIDVSYSRKYVTKHHFGLRWIFHFCFIVHSLGLQLAGAGEPGLKDALVSLGDLLILNERFYHAFFWQSVLPWPIHVIQYTVFMEYSNYGLPEELLCLKFKIFPGCTLLFLL